MVAGIAVTGSTLAWTAGAWAQARMNTRWEGRRLIRIGLGIILAGIVGLAAMLLSSVPVAVGIAAWTIAGFGMGLGYAPTTLMMLKNAPPGREGWASASLNLADVLGSALGIGIGGAAISAAVRFGWPLAAGLAAAFALTALAGVAALAISRRLPSTRTAAPASGPGPGQRGTRRHPRRGLTTTRSLLLQIRAYELAGRAIGATMAPVARTRSAGASWTCNPRWPALQYTVGQSMAVASTTTGSRRRCAIGEIPPTT